MSLICLLCVNCVLLVVLILHQTFFTNPVFPTLPRKIPPIFPVNGVIVKELPYGKADSSYTFTINTNGNGYTIIYKVYTMEDFDEMRKELLEQLKLLVDFDSADFYLASVEDEKKLDRPVMYNCDSNLSEEYEELDYSRGIMLSGKSLIYRETDIINDESRVEMEYYKKVYKPNNWHYSLQVVIAKDHHFLGTITFYRTIGKENFKYDDIFVLDMLKDHLAYRMEKHQRRAGEEGEKLTVTQAVEQYGLTRREDTILRNLMQGKENPVICEELTISTNTLKKHILNIYRKLGIRNRVQLFKMIREHDEAG